MKHKLKKNSSILPGITPECLGLAASIGMNDLRQCVWCKAWLPKGHMENCPQTPWWWKVWSFSQGFVAGYKTGMQNRNRAK
jgi:hypothetical protein